MKKEKIMTMNKNIKVEEKLIDAKGEDPPRIKVFTP